MKTLSVLTFAALLGASSLALMATSAAARVVCNADGDCWHTHSDYDYPPSIGLTIHPDDWKWKEDERHAWREHEGRGYWHGGEWKEF